ncbi:MAG TPA: PEP-CTERM sorting domain-containing protein [Pirellulales bacterium]
MTRITRLAVVAVCAIAGSWIGEAAHGGSIPLTNPTFSMPPQGAFDAQFGGVPGWATPGNNAGVLNYTASSGSPTTEAPYWPSIPAGTTFAFSNGGSLEQITTSPSGIITAGQMYKLVVDAGQGIGVGNPTTNTVTLVAADGTVLNSATVANSAGSFTAETLTYTAPLSGAVLGQQIGVELSSNGVQSSFNTVALATVPEPGALGLLACGVLGLSWFVRRRARTSR